MPIDKSDYEYTVEEGDSLIRIAEKHGFKPITDWARKIWEDSKNEGLYVNANMHGKKVKRQLHLGSNHYEPYDHFRYGPSYRGYDNPSQIILYAGEKIWIPHAESTDRIIHEMTDDELINGFVPEFGKRYELIFPAMKVKVHTFEDRSSDNDKYTLYGYDDKGELIYKKSLIVKEDSEDNNGIKELIFNATPKCLKYTLEVTSSVDGKKKVETVELITDTTYNSNINNNNNMV